MRCDLRLEFAQPRRFFGQHSIDPRIEHLVISHPSCTQVLMALERLEGQRLSAPQKFEFAVQVLDDLDGLGTQRVAWLIGLREDHQKSPP